MVLFKQKFLPTSTSLILFAAVLSACSMSPYQEQPPIYPGEDTPAGRNAGDGYDSASDTYRGYDDRAYDDRGYEHNQPYESESDKEASDQPRRSRPSVRYEQESLSPAAQSLIDEAENESAAGNYQLALTKAERAQRLAPRSPEVYATLGDIYYKRSIRSKANQFYRKALSLASPDYSRREEIERRIEATR